MRRFIAISSAFLLSGCFLQGNLGELRELNPQAEDFGSSLASEYLSYSNSESEQGRLMSSEHFAIKGVKASKGNPVDPDVVNASLADPAKQELTIAREVLLTLLSDDMKEAAPQKAAHAQLLFDCWQYQTVKGSAFAPCADEFKSTIGDLQEIAEDFPDVSHKSHVVIFTGDDLTLGVSQLRLIDKLAKQLHGTKNYTLSLEGYTGSDEDARELAREQLGVVKTALIDRSIPEIRINARTKDDKAVYLSDDVSAVAKNTVKITIRIFVLKGRHS
jgi:OOP family OmpA-OmpF porin